MSVVRAQKCFHEWKTFFETRGLGVGAFRVSRAALSAANPFPDLNEKVLFQRTGAPARKGLLDSYLESRGSDHTDR